LLTRNLTPLESDRWKKEAISTKSVGRTVGALLLLAFLVYGGGSALVASGSGTTDVLSEVAKNEVQVSAGALLMLVNSAFVASIGVLMFPVLKPHHKFAAHAYLVTRVVEAVMLAVGTLSLLLLIPLGHEYVAMGTGKPSVLPSLARVAQEGSQYAYWMAMIALGLGSLPFCLVLLRANLVPTFMAVWGMVGYAIFTAGGILEILGYGTGLALSVPGGLFELALGVLLIARGFPARGRSGPLRPSSACIDRPGSIRRIPFIQRGLPDRASLE
jgi:Domain of unknown function (DUF4386)